MDDATRRRMVFCNVANGLSAEHIARAYNAPLGQIEADLAFVVRKLRSYRFERGMRLVACSTPAEIVANRFDLLWTLDRVNLATDPKYRAVHEVPFSPGNGGAMSDGERMFLSGLRTQ